MFGRELIVQETHRAVWYEDGVFKKVVGAGRHIVPPVLNLGLFRLPRVRVELVDVREREFTIKGQEILTADKVAIRVSILVQFQVADPAAALHVVENYADRLYSDVQLAARRALATMSLEEILTHRNRLSAGILQDVKETAARYGVQLLRADVKDLVFPGNLQEVMNKVLAAERMSQTQLVEARTRAEVQRIEAQARGEIQRTEADAASDAGRRLAEGEAEVKRISTASMIEALQRRAQTADLYEIHSSLLRLEELETLRELGRSAQARIYVGFEKPARSLQETG